MKNGKFKDLCYEIASMLETGTLTVGAFGLSQNSVDFVMEKIRAEIKIKQRRQTVKELKKKMSYAAIGRKLGITRERVRQLANF